IARLPVWRGTYALMCDDAGTVIDDGTLFRLGPELFRWCCGSEESGRALTSLAKTDDLKVRIHALRGSMPIPLKKSLGEVVALMRIAPRRRGVPSRITRALAAAAWGRALRAS
ncbi:MAG: hypothetical protein AAGJ28_26200, partial [Pseudomonadota bacterium]